MAESITLGDRRGTLSSSPKPECWNWIDLPDDITASILSRLSMFDILERAQKVCLTWRRICKNPKTWRTIDMKFDIHLCQQIEGYFSLNNEIELAEETKTHLHQFLNFNIHKMCHHAIDLSCGDLVDISIQNCGTNDLLEHMTDSSRGIRRLSIVFSAYITMKGLSKVASKLPLLEDLEISYTTPENIAIPVFITPDTEHKYLEVIGRSCPLLKSLKLNKHQGSKFKEKDNRAAFAIARTMHGLQSLQLIGNRLNHQGLHAILGGCRRLESLDLRQCIHLYLHSQGFGWLASLEGCLEGCSSGRERTCSCLEDLKTRCFEQIKKLWLSNGSADELDDYEHHSIHKIVDRQFCEFLKHM